MPTTVATTPSRTIQLTGHRTAEYPKKVHAYHIATSSRLSHCLIIGTSLSVREFVSLFAIAVA